jgi:hypothetical protein
MSTGSGGETSNFSIAQSSQTQFMQYAIALTFAILGLSVQTTHLGAYLIADCVELVAWASLLISGMLGLYRWSEHPAIYNLFGHKENIDAKVAALEQAHARGVETVLSGAQERVVVSEMLPKWRDLAKDIERAAAEGVEGAHKQYKWQRGLFALGIVCLVASRAYDPVAHIICSLTMRLPYASKP